MKPIKRIDCINGERPCPWISCKHHMLWAMAPRLGNHKPEVVIRTFVEGHTYVEIIEMMETYLKAVY